MDGLWSFFGCILFIPYLVSFGYYLETLRQSSEGEERLMPEWDRWGDYMARGFWSFLIGLVYLIIPTTLAVTGTVSLVVGAFGGAAHNSAAAAAGGMGFGAMCLMAAAILSLLISFFVPMALLRYGRSLKMGDAFNVGGLFADIMKAPGDYFVSWIVPVLIGMVGHAVLGAVGVGVFLMPALQFYIMMVNANLLGQYYRAHLAESYVASGLTPVHSETI